MIPRRQLQAAGGLLWIPVVLGAINVLIIVLLLMSVLLPADIRVGAAKVLIIVLVVSGFFQAVCVAFMTFGSLGFVFARMRGQRPSAEPSAFSLLQTRGERPLDSARLDAALANVEASDKSASQWLRPAIEQWLATPAGPERDKLRNALLDRLYAEASKPGDYAQRRALNEVRLAINPWAD
jgi:hypothetical protein